MSNQVEPGMDGGNASLAVQHNLEYADKVQSLNGDVHAAVEAHGGPAGHEVEPTALWMNGTAWVSLAMLVFIVILLWKKVPAAIGGNRTTLSFGPYDHKGHKGMDMMVIRRLTQGRLIMEGRFEPFGTKRAPQAAAPVA